MGKITQLTCCLLISLLTGCGESPVPSRVLQPNDFNPTVMQIEGAKSSVWDGSWEWIDKSMAYSNRLTFKFESGQLTGTYSEERGEVTIFYELSEIVFNDDSIRFSFKDPSRSNDPIYSATSMKLLSYNRYEYFMEVDSSGRSASQWYLLDGKWYGYEGEKPLWKKL